ncbi:hypothetical protein [Conexibacter sp. SYSU D00693]|uniref:hypothetical protein n=1 Tax=Conexibacter sp. SYSU D00693 TaxID=2812560 RepID=UPI00196B8E06|nr:hypothetical protein [Conexibacter sp. SYSU D00693]
MASTITLIPKGDRETAARILDEFAEETGLTGTETEDGGRVFDVEGTEHEIPFVQTLDEIDPTWTEHLEFSDPA